MLEFMKPDFHWIAILQPTPRSPLFFSSIFQPYTFCISHCGQLLCPCPLHWMLRSTLTGCTSVTALQPFPTLMEECSGFFPILPAAVLRVICKYFIFLSLLLAVAYIVISYFVGQRTHKKEKIWLNIPNFARKSGWKTIIHRNKPLNCTQTLQYISWYYTLISHQMLLMHSIFPKRSPLCHLIYFET